MLWYKIVLRFYFVSMPLNCSVDNFCYKYIEIELLCIFETLWFALLFYFKTLLYEMVNNEVLLCYYFGLREAVQGELL